MIFHVDEPWLRTGLADLRGVGPERKEQFQRLGILSVQDLLLHRPRRYEDRRYLKKIQQIGFGEQATTRGVILAAGLKKWAHGSKSVYEMILEDGTGRLYCRWWNMPFVQKYYKVGDELLVFGKCSTRRPLAMDHPETEVLDVASERFIHIDRVVPIYPATEGLSQRSIRALVWSVMEKFEKEISILQDLCSVENLPALADSFKQLHFPVVPEEAGKAREKLAFVELFHLQKELLQRRHNLNRFARATPCPGTNELIRKFLPSLPFDLTESQTKVLREIRADLGRGIPMRRLLQGDVGSGKTLVAACSALMVLENQMSVALMVPTQILAEQHYRNFQKWLEPLNIAVHLVTSEHSEKGSLDQPQLPLAAPSQESVFIGTHALLEAPVEIPNLGLVIIDEQHKFGVAQREKLVRKGRYPHLLVMTATPIPRTLGLTVYGDLDVSVIDKMPRGRPEIETFVRDSSKLPQIWKFVKQQLG